MNGDGHYEWIPGGVVNPDKDNVEVKYTNSYIDVPGIEHPRDV